MVVAFILAVFLHFVGFFYAVFIFYIPIIYANFLVTTVAAMTAGYATQILTRLANIRCRQHRIGLSIFAGLVLWYSSWTAFFLILETEHPSFGQYYLDALHWLNPVNFLNAVLVIAETGAYNIGSIPVNGLLAYAVWLLEFGVLLGLPFFVFGRKQVAPFSEDLNKWYGRFKLEPDFQFIAGSSSFIEQFQSIGPEVIEQMDKGRAERHAKFIVYYLPDEKQQFLGAENVEYDSTQKRSKSSWVHAPVTISSEEAQDLMQRYHAKKEFWIEI